MSEWITVSQVLGVVGSDVHLALVYPAGLECRHPNGWRETCELPEQKGAPSRSPLRWRGQDSNYPSFSAEKRTSWLSLGTHGGFLVPTRSESTTLKCQTGISSSGGGRRKWPVSSRSQSTPRDHRRTFSPRPVCGERGRG